MNAAQPARVQLKLVVTESEFRRLLRRGYAGQVVPDEGTGSPRFEPIELIPPTLLARRGETISNPDNQLGEPISIAWNDAVLAEIGESQLVETVDGILHVHALLPLLSGTFIARFKSQERSRQFQLELDTELDSKLLQQFELGEVDPDLVSSGATERSPRNDRTLSLPLNDAPPGVPEDVLHKAIRLERLQNAAKLVFASESGATLTTMASALIDSNSTADLSELGTDLSSIRWMRQEASSLLSAACDYLLSRPARSTLSPLSIEEKSDLVDTVARHVGKNHTERDLLEKLLHLIRCGESLNHLLEQTANESIQGLVIFMSNNRDPREVAGLKSKNFGVTPSALAVCAFLTGLRYQSHLLPIDILWPPLRRADILDFTAMINQCSWGAISAKRRTTVTSDQLHFDEDIFVRPTQVDVLDLIDCRRWIRVRTSKDSFAHNRASRVIVRERSGLSRCKITRFGEIREVDHSAFSRSFDIQPKKSSSVQTKSWKILQFGNRQIDEFIESVEAVEIKVDGEFWIELRDGKLHRYSSASVVVPFEALGLRELGPGKKIAPSKLRTLLVESMSRRTVDLRKHSD